MSEAGRPVVLVSRAGRSRYPHDDDRCAPPHRSGRHRHQSRAAGLPAVAAGLRHGRGGRYPPVRSGRHRVGHAQRRVRRSRELPSGAEQPAARGLGPPDGDLRSHRRPIRDPARDGPCPVHPQDGPLSSRESGDLRPGHHPDRHPRCRGWRDLPPHLCPRVRPAELHPRAAGIIDQQILWLSVPPLAMVSVASVDIWQWTAFVYLVLFAALQTVPHEAVEAAQVDGPAHGRNSVTSSCRSSDRS